MKISTAFPVSADRFRSPARGGFVTVLVLLLIFLIMMMTVTYLRTMRVYSVSRPPVGVAASAAVAAQLATDLAVIIGADGELIKNEPHDYPWTSPRHNAPCSLRYQRGGGSLDIVGALGDPFLDDSWLAPCEPEGGVWKQVSNPFGSFLVYDLADFSNVAPNFSTRDRVPMDAPAGCTIPQVAVDGSGVERWVDFQGKNPANENSVPAGLSVADPRLVDTDGDGVGDALWFYPKSMGYRNGVRYVAAVRIVDLSGMLNLNTAFGEFAADPGTQATAGGNSVTPRKGEGPYEINAKTLLGYSMPGGALAFHQALPPAVPSGRAVGAWNDWDYWWAVGARTVDNGTSFGAGSTRYSLNDEAQLREYANQYTNSVYPTIRGHYPALETDLAMRQRVTGLSGVRDVTPPLPVLFRFGTFTERNNGWDSGHGVARTRRAFDIGTQQNNLNTAPPPPGYPRLSGTTGAAFTYGGSAWDTIHFSESNSWYGVRSFLRGCCEINNAPNSSAWGYPYPIGFNNLTRSASADDRTLQYEIQMGPNSLQDALGRDNSTSVGSQWMGWEPLPMLTEFYCEAPYVTMGFHSSCPWVNSSAAPVVIMPNTTLAQIPMMAGVLNGGNGGWGDRVDSDVYFWNASAGTITFQLQNYDGTYTRVAMVTLTQSGADVAAAMTYRWKAGDNRGVDASTFTGGTPSGDNWLQCRFKIPRYDAATGTWTQMYANAQANRSPAPGNRVNPATNNWEYGIHAGVPSYAMELANPYDIPIRLANVRFNFRRQDYHVWDTFRWATAPNYASQDLGWYVHAMGANLVGAGMSRDAEGYFVLRPGERLVLYRNGVENTNKPSASTDNTANRNALRANARAWQRPFGGPTVANTVTGEVDISGRIAFGPGVYAVNLGTALAPPNWVATAAYAAGDLVSDGGTVYAANAALSAGGASPAGNPAWTAYVAWNAAVNYPANTYVSYMGNVYKATAAIAAGAAVPTANASWTAMMPDLGGYPSSWNVATLDIEQQCQWTSGGTALGNAQYGWMTCQRMVFQPLFSAWDMGNCRKHESGIPNGRQLPGGCLVYKQVDVRTFGVDQKLNLLQARPALFWSGQNQMPVDLGDSEIRTNTFAVAGSGLLPNAATGAKPYAAGSQTVLGVTWGSAHGASTMPVGHCTAGKSFWDYDPATGLGNISTLGSATKVAFPGPNANHPMYGGARQDIKNEKWDWNYVGIPGSTIGGTGFTHPVTGATEYYPGTFPELAGPATNTTNAFRTVRDNFSARGNTERRDSLPRVLDLIKSPLVGPIYFYHWPGSWWGGNTSYAGTGTGNPRTGGAWNTNPLVGYWAQNTIGDAVNFYLAKCLPAYVNYAAAYPVAPVTTAQADLETKGLGLRGLSLRTDVPYFNAADIDPSYPSTPDTYSASQNYYQGQEVYSGGVRYKVGGTGFGTLAAPDPTPAGNVYPINPSASSATLHWVLPKPPTLKLANAATWSVNDEAYHEGEMYLVGATGVGGSMPTPDPTPSGNVYPINPLAKGAGTPYWVYASAYNADNYTGMHAKAWYNWQQSWAEVLCSRWQVDGPWYKGYTANNGSNWRPGMINLNTASKEVLMCLSLPFQPGTTTPVDAEVVADAIIASRKAPAQTYNSTVRYQPGQQVSRNGRVYTAIASVLGQSPANFDHHTEAKTNPWVLNGRQGLVLPSEGFGCEASRTASPRTGTHGYVPVTEGFPGTIGMKAYTTDNALLDGAGTGRFYTSNPNLNLETMAWLPQQATCRSDAFCAYIVVQGYDETDFTRGPLDFAKLVVLYTRDCAGNPATILQTKSITRRKVTDGDVNDWHTP